MSNRTYFFPPAPDSLPSVQADFDEIYAATLKAIIDLARSYCPVCRRFSTDTEIHIVDSATGQCYRIVNLSIPERTRT